MRIAIVTETFLPSTDGVVTRLTKAIRHFRKKGHDVLVIAPDLGVNEFEGAKVVGIQPVKLPFYKSRPWTLPSRDVKYILQDYKPDVVHAVNPILLASSAVKYARKLRLPLVASFHTNVPKYMEFYNAGAAQPILWSYLRNLHNQAGVNLVTSNAMYDELDKQEINNLHVLPRGVDIENLSPSYNDIETRLELTDGHPERPLLIFVGRLAHEKNIHTLLPLMKERQDLSLAIIGDGPVKEDLEKLFKGTNTVFTGFRHGMELAKAYASADAFIFPSVSETLGLVILEGMASGLPVIAVRSGPTMEQIEDGENGLLYDDGDLKSLSNAVDKLKDIDLVMKLKKNARIEAEKYSWDNASEALLKHYENMVSEYRSSLGIIE